MPFKAYDIRGRVPEQLNFDIAYRIGIAYAQVIRPEGRVAVGRDIRLSSHDLAMALIEGLNVAGVDTFDIGLSGTEMIYHAAAMPGMGGGIMVTASHNPIDYNGMKMVRAGAVPISGETGLRAIEAQLAKPIGNFPTMRGRNEQGDILDDYVRKVLSFVDTARIKPLRIIANGGNGCAGPVFDAIAASLPFEVIHLNHAPDGTFPNGIPNPLLPENRKATAEAVRANKADLGIAWDGDFDRCFFFDEQGRFIEGYYIVGLLAAQLLQHHPDQKIIHDPRLTWNTIEMVKAAGGIPVQNKTGHAFIKERMRKEDAIYGGEMSAHHYFRDFAYCDSGMIPWLLVTEHLSTSGKKLSALVEECIAAYPCSGEMNYRVTNAEATMEHIETHYKTSEYSPAIDRTDGLSMDFDTWRFNLRSSNTEPLLRLNVEARGDMALMEVKVDELINLIQGESA